MNEHAIANVYLDLSFLLRMMFVKIYFYKLAFALKRYKLMWEYLALNLKADVKRDLFNQNGMDVVTEISFCKTPVVDEKGWFLEVESQLS